MLVNKFHLIEILYAFISILCSAQSMTIEHNDYIASSLIEFFYNP